MFIFWKVAEDRKRTPSSTPHPTHTHINAKKRNHYWQVLLFIILKNAHPMLQMRNSESISELPTVTQLVGSLCSSGTNIKHTQLSSATIFPSRRHVEWGQKPCPFYSPLYPGAQNGLWQLLVGLVDRREAGRDICTVGRPLEQLLFHPPSALLWRLCSHNSYCISDHVF